MQLPKTKVINADATINSGVTRKRCVKKKLSNAVDSCKSKNLVQSDRKKRITSETKPRFSDIKEKTELHPAFTPAGIRNKSILCNSKKLPSNKKLLFGANTPVNKSTFHSNKKSTTVHKLNTQNLSSGKKKLKFSSSKRSTIVTNKYQNNERVPSKSRLALDGTKKMPEYRPERSEDFTLALDGTKRHKRDAHSPTKNFTYKIPQMPVVPGYTSDYEKMVHQYFATQGLSDVGANLTYMDNKLLEKVTNTVTRRNDEINQFRRVSTDRDRIVPVEDLANVLRISTDYQKAKDSMNIFGETFADAFNDENYIFDDAAVFMQNLDKARKREILLKIRTAPVLEEPMPELKQKDPKPEPTEKVPKPEPTQKVPIPEPKQKVPMPEPKQKVPMKRAGLAKTKDQEIIAPSPPKPITQPPAAPSAVTTPRKVEPSKGAQQDIGSRPEPTKERRPSREHRGLRPTVKPRPSKTVYKDEPVVTRKATEHGDQELTVRQTKPEVVMLGISPSAGKVPNISSEQKKKYSQKN